MTDHDIRVLDDSQYRAAHTLFRSTLHHPPTNDDAWKFIRESYEPGRALGAFAEDELIGTVQAFPSRMAVPGGAVVPHAAVSRVGVRSDWTRRGVLSALQRAQLRSFVESGDVVATLRATESLIYGRFGYGVASRYRTVRVDRSRAVPRTRIAGRVRLVDLEAGERIARSLYEEVAPRRVGTIGRWPAWWSMNLHRPTPEDNPRIAVRSSAGQDDGFLLYKVKPGAHDVSEKKPTILEVVDLWARTPEAWADLWLFALGVDLVAEVVAFGRPVDEPVEWLLGDRRACKAFGEEDETWLRLVDVPAALGARTYHDGAPVLIGVRDTYLPDNTGTYRVSADGVSRVSDAPEVVLDVDTLASTYLGDVSFSTLAATRRLDVVAPDAPVRADALFAVSETPWCGTYF
ncbi:GNAT family N-acetyltransferase [Saccharothrix sp. BKS2]|uniref:GNAT family N-acetyltransferase n=1 Tax=Saccharothrix sp. BKS2 TaxID=3064400 RepID=UPI0039EC6ECE